jgi:transmembrane sensor
VRVEELGGEIELTPGKQLVTRLDNTTTQSATPNVIRDIDVAKVTGWREGRIYFDDLSLAEAVREMNRHSTVHILIASPELAELRINGMFKAGEQELFVSALQEYFQISTQRPSAREIVLTNR